MALYQQAIPSPVWWRIHNTMHRTTDTGSPTKIQSSLATWCHGKQQLSGEQTNGRSLSLEHANVWNVCFCLGMSSTVSTAADTILRWRNFLERGALGNKYTTTHSKQQLSAYLSSSICHGWLSQPVSALRISGKRTAICQVFWGCNTTICGRDLR